MTDEKLISMANHIAAFFASQPGDEAARKTADHLMDFWAPSMRTQFKAAAERGAEGLSSPARAAADLI